MKRFSTILLACFTVAVLVSCSKEFASPKDSNIGVFEELSQFVEENYALFDLKQVNWTSIKAKYRPKVSNLMSQDSFYVLCQNAVNELKDGHSSVSRGNYPIGYDSREDYDIQFEELVAFNYVKSKRYFDFGTYGGPLNDTMAYVRIGSFYRDWTGAINHLAQGQYKKIILDLRNTYYEEQSVEAFSFVGHFSSSPINAGSIVHKTGKGLNDFKKVPIVIKPALPYLGNKKVIILTNRNTFYVSTYIAAVLQDLPNVTLIGQVTGPGSGVELPYELPNGWIVAVASNYFMPTNGRHLEDGIRPDIEINNTAADLQNKRDRMLERAIAQ